MPFTIRPFEPTESEYEAVVEIMNIHYPHREATVAGLREFDQVSVTETTYARFVGEIEGRVIAVSACGQPPHWHNTGKYLLEFDCHPDHEQIAFVQALYDQLMQILAGRQAMAFLTETSETNTARLDFLAKHGFDLVQRRYNSKLDLNSFEATPHLSAFKKIQDHHISIYTLAELQAADSEWLPKLAELRWQIRQDIPNSEPPVRETLVEFQKQFERPSFRADAWFIAIDETDGQLGEGQYVGLSHLWVNREQPSKVRTGITGVVRTHRRQGIATALKLRALGLAKQLGAKTIPTSNEANNSMYQINLALGFKPEPAWLIYRKILT